jgi:hypothetical protein
MKFRDLQLIAQSEPQSLVYLTFLKYRVSRGKEKGKKCASGNSILEAKKHYSLLCYEQQGRMNPVMKREHQRMGSCLCNDDDGWYKSSTVQHDPKFA